MESELGVRPRSTLLETDNPRVTHTRSDLDVDRTKEKKNREDEKKRKASGTKRKRSSLEDEETTPR